ncbi:MAG: MotA/TolQ/ExbB proton channel family protein [Myxococcales bacterium]|nr:MotA/TolQ/ExbB proton channel family protein [Myxococcales bacterium]
MPGATEESFDVIEAFVRLAGLGAEWVLWLLLALGVMLGALVIERLRLLARTRVDTAALGRVLVEHLEGGRLSEARALVDSGFAMEQRVIADGLSVFERGPRAVEHVMRSATERERQRFERSLGFMGTLGSNAPFIGLLGTVIGIIVAFQQLAEHPSGGMDVVGPGIAEALVATAVGLLIAIPAVIAFNTLRSAVDDRLSNTELLGRIVLSHAQAPVTADAERG